MRTAPVAPFSTCAPIARVLPSDEMARAVPKKDAIFAGGTIVPYNVIVLPDFVYIRTAPLFNDS